MTMPRRNLLPASGQWVSLLGVEAFFMTRSQKFFFFTGLGFLVAFVLSGQYLRHIVRPQLGEDMAHRMMARASHLYLLFVSLLILLASLVELPATGGPIRTAMKTGRVALLASGT